MDKESIIELQKIDCNCNDCKFMNRDSEKFKLSIEKHYKWQLDYFEMLRNKLIIKANWYKDKFNDLENWDLLLTQAESMVFQFNKSTASTNFGHCIKFDKDVSFIPNICQINTQQCFNHRRN